MKQLFAGELYSDWWNVLWDHISINLITETFILDFWLNENSSL